MHDHDVSRHRRSALEVAFHILISLSKGALETCNCVGQEVIDYFPETNIIMPDIDKLPKRVFSPSSSQDSIIKASEDVNTRRASLSLESILKNGQDNSGPVSSASTPARLYELENAVANEDKILGEGSAGAKPKWRRYAGIIFTLLASICFSLSVTLIKTLNNYDPLSIAIFRFGGVVVPIVPIVIYYKCRGVAVFSSIWPLTQKQKLVTFARLTVRQWIH